MFSQEVDNIQLIVFFYFKSTHVYASEEKYLRMIFFISGKKWDEKVGDAIWDMTHTVAGGNKHVMAKVILNSNHFLHSIQYILMLNCIEVIRILSTMSINQLSNIRVIQVTCRLHVFYLHVRIYYYIIIYISEIFPPVY